MPLVYFVLMSSMSQLYNLTCQALQSPQATFNTVQSGAALFGNLKVTGDIVFAGNLLQTGAGSGPGSTFPAQTAASGNTFSYIVVQGLASVGSLQCGGLANLASINVSSLQCNGLANVGSLVTTGTASLATVLGSYGSFETLNVNNAITSGCRTSGGSGLRVNGAGGVGSVVNVDWSTFAGGVPTWRWSLTDIGNYQASMCLQAGASNVMTFTPTSTTIPNLRTPSVAFNNPVLDRSWPDPFVLVDNGVYYSYATNDNGCNIQVATSPDLVSWVVLPDALPTLPTWATGGFTWAPTVYKRPDGIYVLYHCARYQNGLQAIGVATSTTAAGPYTPQYNSSPLVSGSGQGGAIDPSPFLDTTTSTLYLVWKTDGNSSNLPCYIFVQALGSDAMTLTGNATAIITNDQSWEGTVVEGPQLTVRSEHGQTTYHLLYSGNGYYNSTYAVGYATATSVTGPYTKQGQIMQTCGVVVGPGKCMMFTDLFGTLQLAYHSWAMQGTSNYSYRALNITAVSFNGDLIQISPTWRRSCWQPTRASQLTNDLTYFPKPVTFASPVYCTASAGTALTVSGVGGYGSNVDIDWTTFAGGNPCFRWMLTDTGNYQASMALQATGGGSATAAMANVLTFSPSNVRVTNSLAVAGPIIAQTAVTFLYRQTVNSSTAAQYIPTSRNMFSFAAAAGAGTSDSLFVADASLNNTSVAVISIPFTGIWNVTWCLRFNSSTQENAAWLAPMTAAGLGETSGNANGTRLGCISGALINSTVSWTGFLMQGYTLGLAVYSYSSNYLTTATNNTLTVSLLQRSS